MNTISDSLGNDGSAPGAILRGAVWYYRSEVLASILSFAFNSFAEHAPGGIHDAPCISALNHIVDVEVFDSHEVESVNDSLRFSVCERVAAITRLLKDTLKLNNCLSPVPAPLWSPLNLPLEPANFSVHCPAETGIVYYRPVRQRSEFANPYIDSYYRLRNDLGRRCGSIIDIQVSEPSTCAIDNAYATNSTDYFSVESSAANPSCHPRNSKSSSVNGAIHPFVNRVAERIPSRCAPEPWITNTFLAFPKESLKCEMQSAQRLGDYRGRAFCEAWHALSPHREVKQRIKVSNSLAVLFINVPSVLQVEVVHLAADRQVVEQHVLLAMRWVQLDNVICVHVFTHNIDG